MRLHSDTLTAPDIYDAARTAGVTILGHCQRKGSRSRDHAYDVWLTGSSAYRTQYAGTMDHKAATWDEWGIFLGVLFDRDPRMIAGGPNGYVGAVDYAWQTGDRFRRDLDSTTAHGPVVHSPADQHRRHNWLSGQGGTCVTGAYFVQSCTCGAVRRWLTGGATRETLGLDVPDVSEISVPCAYCRTLTAPEDQAAAPWYWPRRGLVTNCHACAGTDDEDVPA